MKSPINRRGRDDIAVEKNKAQPRKLSVLAAGQKSGLETMMRRRRSLTAVLLHLHTCREGREFGGFASLLHLSDLFCLCLNRPVLVCLGTCSLYAKEMEKKSESWSSRTRRIAQVCLNDFKTDKTNIILIYILKYVVNQF